MRQVTEILGGPAQVEFIADQSSVQLRQRHRPRTLHRNPRAGGRIKGHWLPQVNHPRSLPPPKCFALVYRAIDQFGQVIDVLVSEKRDMATTHRFFTRALEHGPPPTEVTTDRAAAYPRVLDELVPAARHVTERYANNAIEADHGRLKSRLRPMRGLTQLRCARVISAGHAFIQNIRRGHDELRTEEVVILRVLAAFDELALAI